MYAVGDGNHSLNTAKFVWDQVKTSLTGNEYLVHPSRYALVELVNIYDESINFKPIHRLLSNVSLDTVKEAALNYYPGAQLFHFAGYQDMLRGANKLRSQSLAHVIPLVGQGQYCALHVEDYCLDNEYDTLARFLDSFLSKEEASLDFVVREDEVKTLAERSADSVGFIMPALQKY